MQWIHHDHKPIFLRACKFHFYYAEKSMVNMKRTDGTSMINLWIQIRHCSHQCQQSWNPPTGWLQSWKKLPTFHDHNIPLLILPLFTNIAYPFCVNINFCAIVQYTLQFTKREYERELLLFFANVPFFNGNNTISWVGFGLAHQEAIHTRSIYSLAMG